MDRRTFLRAAGASSSVALAGCTGLLADSRPGGENYDVGMSSRDFRPGRLEIAVGETVRWRNTSSHAHTVTAYEAALPDDAAYFASGGFEREAAARDGWRGSSGGALYQGDAYEHTFEVPGTYRYFCIPHEASNMIGTVVVSEPTATGTTTP